MCQFDTDAPAWGHHTREKFVLDVYYIPHPLPNENGGGINMGESLNTLLV